MGIYVGDKRYAPYVGGKRRVMGDGGGTPLPYDAEIEYLESTRGQYINTLHIIEDGDTIECEICNTDILASPENKGWGAAGQSGIKNNIDGGLRIINSKITYFFTGSNYTTTPELINTPYRYYHELFHISQLNPYVKLRDLENNLLYTVDNMVFRYGFPTLPIFLFKASGQYHGIGAKRIKYYKIVNDNHIILNLIPVRIGTTGYMYDKVSGELFGNSGTGDFVLGPDINN